WESTWRRRSSRRQSNGWKRSRRLVWCAVQVRFFQSDDRRVHLAQERRWSVEERALLLQEGSITVDEERKLRMNLLGNGDGLRHQLVVHRHRSMYAKGADPVNARDAS